jgi:CTP:molybdopterin cytidylyltransferase MocA/ADP-ribose pyrophosphatase YjhB (NUDIX family)
VTPERIAVIVLAAGQSSRLGQPKQLLRVAGRPLLERTLDVVRASSLTERLLVTGAHADAITAALEPRGFRFVHNPDFASGQASSLRAGLQALSDHVAGAIVMLGDQPLVPPWMLDQMAERFDPEQHAALRPRYADGPGNPVLLSRALFPDLLALTGDVGARDVLRHHADRILELDFTTRRAPRDVDTLEDFTVFLLDWSASGAPDVPRYCQRCGSEVGIREVHARNRPVCPRCNFTYFFDPKIAAAVVVDIDGRIVLQKRRNDPGIGKWTFPGGFIDRGESVPEGAAREVWEEVGLTVSDLQLLNVYSEPGETVILVGFAATLHGVQPSVGDESSEVGLFAPDALPALAFHRDQQVIADWLRR